METKLESYYKLSIYTLTVGGWYTLVKLLKVKKGLFHKKNTLVNRHKTLKYLYFNKTSDAAISPFQIVPNIQMSNTDSVTI